MIFGLGYSYCLLPSKDVIENKITFVNSVDPFIADLFAT